MKRVRSFLIISLVLVCSVGTIARTDKRARRDGQEGERSVTAAANVHLTVCSRSGNIKVHGWDRNEVRVRTDESERVDFQRSGTNNEPARELTLVSGASDRRRAAGCSSDNDFSIDVPRGATVELTTRDGDINVADVGTAHLHTQGGSIMVDQVNRGVDASSIGGDVSIQNAKGLIKLATVGGEIVVRDSGPNLATDVCEANTVGGDIRLLGIDHAAVNINTVSGSLALNGSLPKGARYNLNSLSGDVMLRLPSNASFRLSATITSGVDIDSDFPLNTTSQEKTDTVRKHEVSLKHIEAIYGTGDAMINVSSFSGSLSLKKR
jgi:DUF4097 and DUF4098 domain-containing protein YvlB